MDSGFMAIHNIIKILFSEYSFLDKNGLWFDDNSWQMLALSQFGLVDHIWQALIVTNIGKILLLEV
jgi:hypothetical protein